MGAATATLKASIDIQPTLNAQGLPTGVEFAMAQNVIQQAIAVTARRAFSINLPGIGNTQALAFGDVTTGQFIFLVATVAGVLTPVRITSTQTGSSGCDAWAAIFGWTMDVAHPITACTVTSTAINTVVDVFLAG